VKSSVTPSVASSAWYCLTSEAWVWVRMASKSSTDSDCSSTRIGKRPATRGSGRSAWLRWNAPEAMNRMWSVLIIPYLVDTVVPSTSGSRSRCTPWRDTSALPPSAARGHLVDLVDEDDAVLLGVVQRPHLDLFFVDQLGRFFVDQQLHRLGDFELARCAWPAPSGQTCPQLLGHLLHAGGPHDLQLRAGSPDRFRSRDRRADLRAASCGKPGARCCRCSRKAGCHRHSRGGGTSTSRMRSSAASSAACAACASRPRGSA
jgi:hypothetical protein